jgi:acyl-CoA thioesterase-2
MSQFKDLLQILDLQKEDDSTFIGNSLDIGSFSVYGGQVLAQSVAAASSVLDDEKVLHSLHGYFLRPGDISIPIKYIVDVFKEGRSFNTVRISGLQKDKTIFIMAASYHIREEGIHHQSAMPNVAQPESLTSFSDLFAQFAEKFDVKPKGIFSPESPIIFRPVEHYNPFNPGIRPPSNHTWFKINGSLEQSSLKLRQAILTYASDFNLLITSMMPHNMSMFTNPIRLASLDHAMWFHEDVSLDDWILYAVESPYAGAARGFCTGKMYTRAGRLIASVTQEGLVRQL